MGRRVLAAIFVILALGGVGLAGWLMLRPAPKSSATLPNGVQIKVEGVTFGTNHVFTTDSKLTRALRKLLPASLQRLLPAPYASRETTTEPQEVVYLSAFDPATRTYTTPAWNQFQVID